jgi:hypothetical protein
MGSKLFILAHPFNCNVFECIWLAFTMSHKFLLKSKLFISTASIKKKIWLKNCVVTLCGIQWRSNNDNASLRIDKTVSSDVFCRGRNEESLCASWGRIVTELRAELADSDDRDDVDNLVTESLCLCVIWSTNELIKTGDREFSMILSADRKAFSTIAFMFSSTLVKWPRVPKYKWITFERRNTCDSKFPERL